jgi:hypothetical protein
VGLPSVMWEIKTLWRSSRQAWPFGVDRGRRDDGPVWLPGRRQLVAGRVGRRGHLSPQQVFPVNCQCGQARAIAAIWRSADTQTAPTGVPLRRGT